MHPINAIEKAHTLFNEKKYTHAAEAFSKIATDLYIQNENSDIGEIAMKFAVESYRQILDPKLLHHILSLANDNLFLQFFSIRCYLEDHHFENNAEKIEHTINKHVPLNVAEKRLLYGGMIIPQNPNQAHAVTYRFFHPFRGTVVSAQGPREYMEDLHLGSEILLPNGKKVALLGVLDGHGGDKCAKFFKNQIKKQITDHLDTTDDVTLYNSLTKICIDIDEKWKQHVIRPAVKSLDSSGCAAILAVFIENTLWVVGVGDSRAVLGKGSEAIQLSEDAKPPIVKYHLEIMRRGGFVKWNRVDGCLDMARSIGDIFHPSVSAKPCIRKYDLTTLTKENSNILILATDGLWDVIGSQEAVSLCHNFKSHKVMAAELVSAAYNHGSTDNVTAMVVKLT